MDRRLRAVLHLSVVLATALLAVVALPPGIAAPGPGPTPLPSPTAPGSAELPAALLAGPSIRMGFNTAIAQAVPTPAPATGTVTTVLTLWPSSSSFYLTPGPGTPALTTAEVANQYGLSPAQYTALESYFLSRGISVVHAWPDRLFLTIAGPATAVGPAFGTTEMAGVYQGRPVVFASSVPSLPSPFREEVAAASGLTSDLSHFTLPFVSLPNPTQPLATSAGPLQGRTTSTVVPTAVHAMYGFDALYNYSGSSHWATGIGIALLLWGDGYAPSDLASFFSSSYPSQFPAPTIRYYPVDGAPTPSAAAFNDPSTGPQELTLDIEWAGSAAPGATLDAVYAPDGPASNAYSPTDQSMEDALFEAVSTVSGVKVLSMSFGTLDGADAAFQAAFSNSFHEATLKGITILAASGDTGGTATKGCRGEVAPQFPSTSPQVVAVGGTAPLLQENAFGSVTGLESEPAWNLSGGGYSLSYPAPSWQLVGTAAPPIRASGMRGGPDVAGPSSQNVFYFHGKVTYGQGTSFSTPMWAGLIAEMDAVRGTPLGFVTPHLYAVGAAQATSARSGLVDITQGGNCLGPAGTGWDTSTGWGSPRALPLFEQIAGTYVAVNLSASPRPVAPGGVLTADVRASNASSGRGLAALTVFVELDALGYSGPCGGVLATANGPTDANGTFSVGVPVPGCYFGTQVSLSVTVSANGYYGSNQTAVPVNLDGLSGVLAALQQYPYNVIGFVLIMVAATAVGLLVSARHKRRLQARRRPPAVPGGAAGGSTTSPPPGGTAARVAGAGSTAPVSAATLRTPTAVPVQSPAVATAPSEGSPATTPGAPVGALPESSSDSMVGTRCLSCDAPLAADAAQCPSCGARVST
jgi:kumamolisin